MGISTLVAFVIGPLLLFCFIRFGWRLMPVGLGALVLGVLGMGMMYVSLGNMAQDDAAQGNVPALALMLLGIRKGKCLDQLAKACVMDSASLNESVSRYNQAIHCGKPDPQGKSADYCQTLEQGPYYAMNISVTSPVFPLGALTLGGLKVSEESGQVLDTKGSPVPGLFAAGRTAVGIPSNLYVSGLSLAECVFSGRRAGRSVVQLKQGQASGQEQNIAV
mgnify:CR=1 FL=1